MEKQTEEMEAPKQAVAKEEGSWIATALMVPLTLAIFISAVVGAFVIITTWGGSSSTIESDGSVLYEETQWWFLPGDSVKYEYNHVGGHWLRSVKRRGEEDFSDPDALPRAAHEIGQ